MAPTTSQMMSACTSIFFPGFCSPRKGSCLHSFFIADSSTDHGGGKRRAVIHSLCRRTNRRNTIRLRISQTRKISSAAVIAQARARLGEPQPVFWDGWDAGPGLGACVCAYEPASEVNGDSVSERLKRPDSLFYSRAAEEHDIRELLHAAVLHNEGTINVLDSTTVAGSGGRYQSQDGGTA